MGRLWGCRKSGDACRFGSDRVTEPSRPYHLGRFPFRIEETHLLS